MTYILSNTASSISIQTFDAKWLAPIETLGDSVFTEPNYLSTQHIYLAAYLVIMLQGSCNIAEDK